jgi:hypothetical protein
MLHLLFLLGICVSVALGRLQIGIVGQAQAQATATATWSREASDPLDFAIAKVKLDEPGTLTSPPFAIHIANAQETGGTVMLPFNRAGIFHLVAVDSSDPNNVLATSGKFGVNPPNGLPSSSRPDGLPTETSPPSASDTLNAQSLAPPIPSITPNGTSVATSSTKNDPNSIQSKIPVIIGVVATAVGIILLLGVIYFIRRCKARRRYQFQRSMVDTPWNVRFFNRTRQAEQYNASPTPYTNFSPDPEKSDYFSHHSSSPTGVQPVPIHSVAPPYGQNSDLPYTMPVAQRLSAATASTSASHIPSHVRLEPNRLKPLTDRQMDLEDRIYKLQSELINIRRDSMASSDSVVADLKVWKLKAQIDHLKGLKDSSWALGWTDDVPAGLQ